MLACDPRILPRKGLSGCASHLDNRRRIEEMEEDRTVFDATDEASGSPPEPVAESEVKDLHPAQFVNNAAIEGRIAEIADGFSGETTAEEVSAMFAAVAEAVANEERTYEEIVRTALDTATAEVMAADSRLAEAVSEAVVGIEALAENARAALDRVMARQAGILAGARRRLEEARKRLRQLTIGLAGNPDREIPRPDHTLDAVVTIAAMALVLGLEFFVNFGLIQFAVDSRTSASFSIAMAIVASVAAHEAAKAFRVKTGHRDALAECERCFADTDGKDTTTGRKAEVFIMDSSTRMRLWISHGLFIGTCLSVLGLRYSIIVENNRGLGDMAGSVGFVAIVIAYYLFKVGRADRYPQSELGEYFELRDTIAHLEAEVEDLGNPHGEEIEEIKRVHANALLGRKSLLIRTEAESGNLRQRVSKLYARYREGREWFVATFKSAVDALVNEFVADGTEGEDHPALTGIEGRADEVERIYTDLRPALIEEPNIINPPAATMTEEKIDFRHLVEEAWMHAQQAHAEQEEAAERQQADAARRRTIRVRPQMVVPRRVRMNWRGGQQ